GLCLALGTRCVAQRAVEVVRPRVVVALDRSAGAAALQQDRTAVPADIDERAQLAVLVPRHEDRHTPRIGGEERSRLRNLLGAASVLPRAREDPRTIATQQLLSGVPGAWKRPRTCHRRGHSPA